jgi:hypothetical protein
MRLAPRATYSSSTPVISSSSSGLAKFRSIWSALKVVQTYCVPAGVAKGVSSGVVRGRVTRLRSRPGSTMWKRAAAPGSPARKAWNQALLAEMWLTTASNMSRRRAPRAATSSQSPRAGSTAR